MLDLDSPSRAAIGAKFNGVADQRLTVYARTLVIERNYRIRTLILDDTQDVDLRSAGQQGLERIGLWIGLRRIGARYCHKGYNHKSKPRHVLSLRFTAIMELELLKQSQGPENDVLATHADV
jgi:hypothetical protein